MGRNDRTSRLIDRRLATALVFLQACMIPWQRCWHGCKDTTAALSAALGAHWFVAWRVVILPGSRSERQGQNVKTNHAKHVSRHARQSLRL